MQDVTIKKISENKLEPEIKEFLNPRFIFLPILEGFKLKVQDEDYVYKNDIIAMRKDGRIMYSSISGHVLGVKEMLYGSGKKIPSVVIKNDFKENMRSRKSAKKYINDYTKKDFLEVLGDLSIYYKGEYLVDKLDFEDKVVIINAVSVEPNFKNKYFTFKSHIEDILETADLIYTFTHSKKIVLALKNTDSDLINDVMNVIGTYPNIELKLISDAYPNGMDEMLKKNLEEPEAIVFDVEEVMAIYDALKRELPQVEKLITITGNAVRPNRVLKVKIGSLMSEAFINNFDFTYEAVEVHLNGLLRGRVVDTLNFVITSDIEGMTVVQKEPKIQEECMSCGLCSKNCPMGLNPKYVFDHNGNVKKEYYDKCIGCGLCNYNCPANRDLRSFMWRGDER